jgi:hypothetical protein
MQGDDGHGGKDVSGRWGLLTRLGLVPALLAAACMTPGQRREESLQRLAHEFNDGLRWGREDAVLRCLQPEDARLMRARRADLGDDFVIADHEVMSIMMGAGADRATVVAEFSWFNQRQGVVKKSRIEEKWEFVDAHWVVTSQRRLSGERFPLVPEHREAPRAAGP